MGRLSNRCFVVLVVSEVCLASRIGLTVKHKAMRWRRGGWEDEMS